MMTGFILVADSSSRKGGGGGGGGGVATAGGGGGGVGGGGHGVTTLLGHHHISYTTDHGLSSGSSQPQCYMSLKSPSGGMKGMGALSTQFYMRPR